MESVKKRVVEALKGKTIEHVLPHDNGLKILLDDGTLFEVDGFMLPEQGIGFGPFFGAWVDGEVAEWDTE